jgi:hypothetical protein
VRSAAHLSNFSSGYLTMLDAHSSLLDDAEGLAIRKQFAALRTHRREDIYSVCGNHDRSGLSEPEAWWWQKWIDPLGERTEFSGVHPGIPSRGLGSATRSVWAICCSS